MTATETVLIPVAPDRYRFGPGGAVTILGSRGESDGVLFWPPRVLSPTTGGPVTGVELAVPPKPLATPPAGADPAEVEAPLPPVLVLVPVLVPRACVEEPECGIAT